MTTTWTVSFYIILRFMTLNSWIYQTRPHTNHTYALSECGWSHGHLSVVEGCRVDHMFYSQPEVEITVQLKEQGVYTVSVSPACGWACVRNQAMMVARNRALSVHPRFCAVPDVIWRILSTATPQGRPGQRVEWWNTASGMERRWRRTRATTVGGLRSGIDHLHHGEGSVAWPRSVCIFGLWWRRLELITQ